MVVTMSYKKLWAAVACAVLGYSGRGEATEEISRSVHHEYEHVEGTLFSRIDAAESGLEFENAYDDPEMWGSRFQEFQGGAIGTGVAAGDVDGDGWLDLYVVSKTGKNKLFRQVAPLRFEDVTEQAGVSGGDGWGSGASFADVDNDRDLDLYVCHVDAPNMLYLNDGKGRFEEAGAAAGLDIATGSVVGAFEDFDRDGDLDLFLLTNVASIARSPEGEPDYLFENDGTGTFRDVTSEKGIESLPEKGHSATWWDANGDGWADLYIANDFEAPDHLYLNSGDGTFVDVREQALPHTAWFSMGSDFGDINNDGQFDFLVADMAGTTHLKQKIAMGDMGGLVDYMDTLTTPQYMANALYVSNGTDRFLEGARLMGLAKTDWTWSPRFEDLDNDGWIDLHVTNGMVRSFNDSDMLNRAKRARSRAEVVAMMKKSPPLAERNLAYRNGGDWSFEDQGEAWGLDHVGVSFGSVLADFDKDGDIDIVYSNYEDTVSFYRNNSRTNAVTIELNGTESNPHGIGAQVTLRSDQGTQTRRLSLTRGALSTSLSPLHFGLGSGDKVDSVEVKWPSGAVQSFVGLEANSNYLIVEKRAGSNTETPMAQSAALFVEESVSMGLDHVNQELAFNDMVRQPLLPNRMNTLGGGLAWGDADGDGDSDLYVAGAKGRTGALYLNDGEGRFEIDSKNQPWQENMDTEEMAPLWVDFNNDGALDLYVSSGGVEEDAGSAVFNDSLYVNDGEGQFALSKASSLPDSRASGSVVAASDFDKDGDLDLFVGGRVIPGDYPRSSESVLLENHGGSFEQAAKDSVEGLGNLGMVTAAVWSDANNDGWLDLLVAGEWEPIRLFLNHEGVLKEVASSDCGFGAHKGWWNALEPADVDGDGDIDYVVSNVGLNTKYHASLDHPIELYYGDFEGKGEMNIIEAEYEGDKLFPVRGKSCSTRAMPSLGSKFTTFESFGGALLTEIYQLNEAKKYQATELAHGVFINLEDAQFEFRPLPRLAQISTAFGIAARDFDGDGFVDIALGQNFFGPQVETGRFDGGQSLLLLGNGRGDFEATMPIDSGIQIVGEVRGMAVADWNDDGWPDLAVTRANDRMIALRNGGRQGNHSFSVRLEGVQAQVTGARVVVVYDDGRRQAAEISQGSGYLSQSESVLFFGYKESNKPVRIEATWNDGARSEITWKPGLVLMARP